MVSNVCLESLGVGVQKRKWGGAKEHNLRQLAGLLETPLAVPIEAFSFPSPWSGLKYHFKWALLIHIQAP